MSSQAGIRIGRFALAAFVLAAMAPALAGCFGGDKVANDTGTSTMGVSPGVADGAGEPGALPEDAARYGSTAPVPTPGSGEDASTIPAEDRFIIKSKSMRFEVDDVSETVTKVRELVGKYKGNVTNLQLSTQPDVPIYNYETQGGAAGDGAPLQGWITVRVPAAQYEAFVEEALGLGKVLRQSEDSQDVTQEHVDLSARLGNLRAEEKRLREFFDAAKTVEDMLKIETELSRVRGEIEAMDAQIKYLERQAAMATVTFELVTPEPIVSSGGESWGVREALTDAVRWFVGTVNAIIRLLGPLLAIGIFVVLPLYLLLRWVLIRDRKRRQAAAAAAAAEEESAE